MKLFDLEVNNVSSSSDRVARDILSSTKLFKNRIPKGVYSKSYQRICKILADIHDGIFLSNYILDNEHIRLDKENIEYTLKLVEHDWNSVEKLVKSTLVNFNLMHDSKYMPYSKKCLHTDFSLYLYDYYHHDSQFVQCFKKPLLTSEYKSEIKADKIFNLLNNEIKEIGNNLIDFSSFSNPVSFWQFIKDMYDWSLLLLKYDKNSHYFISSPEEFLLKFYQYVISNDLRLRISNFNYMLKSNNPLNWFIKDKTIKHKMNKKIVDCFSENDFKRNFYK